MTPIRRTLYTILKNGEEVFTDLSQNEYFDKMDELAEEFYEKGTPHPLELRTDVKEEEI